MKHLYDYYKVSFRKFYLENILDTKILSFFIVFLLISTSVSLTVYIIVELDIDKGHPV